MIYREACHNAREYTGRTGDPTCVMFQEIAEDYFFVLAVKAAAVDQTCKDIPIISFHSTKYGTVEARDL